MWDLPGIWPGHLVLRYLEPRITGEQPPPPIIIIIINLIIVLF